MVEPTPLSSLTWSSHQIPAYGHHPNTSLQHFPLLIYRSCLPPTLTHKQAEDFFSSVGVVKSDWRSPMSWIPHYHSTTHECMVVSAGSARLCFGGPPDGGRNEGRVEVEVNVGDVMIVPAGVSHGMLENLGGFEMTGAYPIGADTWDFCKGTETDWEEAWEKIKTVKWFTRDPVYGDEGPVMKYGAGSLVSSMM
ncbi:hypothetical protein IAR50_001459 [Cryptococcus sp. DSM 104548]